MNGKSLGFSLLTIYYYREGAFKKKKLDHFIQREPDYSLEGDQYKTHF